MRHVQGCVRGSGTSSKEPAVTPWGVLALFVLGTLGAGGCGSAGHTVVPVSGKITLDGKPVAGASITFQPTASEQAKSAGPGSGGVTDAEGKFVLKTAEAKPRPGAVLGKHVVRIAGAQAQRAPDDDTVKPAAKDPLPARCRDGSLTFEVPASGTDKADFNFQSNEPASKPGAAPGASVPSVRDT